LHGFVHGRKNFAANVQRAFNYVMSYCANIGDDVITEPIQGSLQGIASANSSGDCGVGVGVRENVRPSGYRLRVSLHVTTGTGNPD
jgi:hypothetical protein